MAVADKIDIDIFKVVSQAISETDNLDDMAQQLTQMMVGALGIKGSALFVRNLETDELEAVASFGLSTEYLNKGPVLVHQSIYQKTKGKPVVISDVSATDLLQYPQDARKEGIQAMVSLPIQLSGRMVGVLRLYHFETWQVSDADLANLSLLADYIGLAMMYTRLLNTLKGIKTGLDQVHPVWLR